MGQIIYEEFIQELMAEQRYLPGAELVEKLQQEFGLQEPHARKVIQRAVDHNIIKSSKPITFGKGQYLYAHLYEEITPSLIREVCKKYRPPLYRMLSALDENEGVLSYYEALKISAAIEKKSSSKSNTLDELLTILIDLNFIQIEHDDMGTRYIVDISIGDEAIVKAAISTHYSRMQMDAMFIPDILRWLRRVNLIDNLQIVYRNKQNPSKGALHNNVMWDAFAYTKTSGINPQPGKLAATIDKQTMVTLDVVIHREYSQVDVDGFLARVRLNVNSVKTGVRKIMPIVIYKSASPQILNTLSSLGFLAFNIADIFGKKIYEVVDRIQTIQASISANKDASVEQDVVKTLKWIRDAGQEDNLQNIKGALFEYLLYPVMRTIYPNATIQMGKVLKEKKSDGTKETYEYDFIILSEQPKELIVIEVKGYSALNRIPIGDSNTKNTLSWFFGRTLPFAKKIFQKELSEGYRLRACYITSAGFFKDGMQYISNQKKLKSKKLELYYDGPALISLLTEYDFSHVKTIVERFFITKEEISHSEFAEAS